MMFYCVLQGRQVAINAQTADHADRLVGQIGVVTEWFALVHIGNMHLNERYGDSTQCIAQRNTGVGICRSVDDNESGIGAGCLDFFNQFAFVIALEAFASDTSFIGSLHECIMNVLQRLFSVHLRFTRTQQIQIGAIEDQYLLLRH